LAGKEEPPPTVCAWIVTGLETCTEWSKMSNPRMNTLPVVTERGRPDPDDDKLIKIRADPDARPNIDTIDAVIELALSDDLVIDFAGRIGATPFLRHTPYENHRGATCHIWSCISLSFTRMPNKTLLTHPTIVEPIESDDYNVRNFTNEWVWDAVLRSRYVYLRKPSASPFAGNMFQWLQSGDPDA